MEQAAQLLAENRHREGGWLQQMEVGIHGQ